MQTYAEAPEDARRVIEPTADVEELRDRRRGAAVHADPADRRAAAEGTACAAGGAVAKISHDLRNILTTAQLFADRLEGSADPTVARSMPKLMNSISRAVSLCESTLAFGKAEEPPPSFAA
jgi:signal transduction histidine kinase